MIQEIAPKKFDNAYHAKSPKPDDFVLVFRGHGKPDDRILCRIEDGKIVLPTYSELGCEKHLLHAGGFISGFVYIRHFFFFL